MSKNKSTPSSNPEHFHSSYGASCAGRWRNCPGSIAVIEKAKSENKIHPRGTESAASIEGSLAHDYAYKIRVGEMTIGDVPCEEMRDCLKGYLSVCQEIADAANATGGTVYDESQVPLFYRPEDTGTLDFAGVSGDLDWIQFVDLKYGKGIPVPAEDNNQLIIYALSLVSMIEHTGVEIPDDCRVSLCIYQPRHYSFDGVDAWTTTLRDLKDSGIDIADDYERALVMAKTWKTQDDLILNPSDNACQFCDAKGVCAARGKTHFGGLPPALNVMEDFDDESQIESPKTFSVDLLTTEQINWICNNGKDMKKFIDNTIAAEQTRLLEGGEIHGQKMVPGKLGNRCWNDPAAAEKLIRNKLGAAEAYQPRKLISAPQALTKLKPMVADLSTRFNNRLDELIHRPEGKPLMVPVSDKREALSLTAPEDDFENVISFDDPDISALL